MEGLLRFLRGCYAAAIPAALLLAAPAFGQPTLATLCPEEDAPTEAEYANDPKAWADDFCALAWREPAKATAQLGKMIATTRARANGNRFYFPHSNAEPVQILRPWMADELWFVARKPHPHTVNSRVNEGRLAVWNFSSLFGFEATLTVGWTTFFHYAAQFTASVAVKGRNPAPIILASRVNGSPHLEASARELKCAVEKWLDSDRPWVPEWRGYDHAGELWGFHVDGCTP